MRGFCVRLLTFFFGRGVVFVFLFCIFKVLAMEHDCIISKILQKLVEVHLFSYTDNACLFVFKEKWVSN